MARPAKTKEEAVVETSTAVNEEVKVKKEVAPVEFLMNKKTNKILRSDSFANPKTFASLKKNPYFKQLPNVNGEAVLEVTDKEDYIEYQTTQLSAKDKEIEELKAKLAAAEAAK